MKIKVTLKMLKATDKSIEKWRLIAYKGGTDHGEEDCELCIRYSCKTCPIGIYTARACCFGTPFSEWCRHMNGNHSELGRVVNCPTCKELAVKELNFLRRLKRKLLKIKGE